MVVAVVAVMHKMRHLQAAQVIRQTLHQVKAMTAALRRQTHLVMPQAVAVLRLSVVLVVVWGQVTVRVVLVVQVQHI
jgi:hypothetical protein